MKREEVEEDRWAHKCSRDLAILKYYLIKKVAGEPVPALNVVLDWKLNGRAVVEPSQIILYGRFMTDDYYPMFITKKKKFDVNDFLQKNKNTMTLEDMDILKKNMMNPSDHHIDERINIEEVAGKGTWNYLGTTEIHEDDQYYFKNKSEIIGFRKSFQYSSNRRWKLHMYTLKYPSSDTDDDHQEEWVVYRVVNMFEKIPRDEDCPTFTIVSRTYYYT
ncbi:hypothetical protein FRX31_030732 [Thalictrum thalictroides]|uniref:NAC domain-containing protein n=1 Tax=Thalictrum thalictroides TaxID=46969 RepID=A0A7J6V4T3_THATH|nr:hypothetical protein FRX31_030732 [Thalictrum thalictroides]